MGRGQPIADVPFLTRELVAAGIHPSIGEAARQIAGLVASTGIPSLAPKHAANIRRLADYRKLRDIVVETIKYVDNQIADPATIRDAFEARLTGFTPLAAMTLGGPIRS